MKLIIPIEFYRKGGVERVIISLVECLVDEVEQIILVLPQKHIAYFQTLLPASPKLIYATFDWPPKTWASRLLRILGLFTPIAQQFKSPRLNRLIATMNQTVRIQARLHQLIRQHQATHCLYLLVNGLIPPKLPIPLTMLAHDVFWRFAPLTYNADYVAKYDANLWDWITAADVVFTNSVKTRSDILQIFPQLQPNQAEKIIAIPLSGFLTQPITHASAAPATPPDRPTATPATPNPVPTFFFPSSFGIYKDHLTLLEAGITLIQRQVKFQIILVGRETDGLINGQLNLSQQKTTSEYNDYLQRCQAFYTTHQAVIPDYFMGAGYCSYTAVEAYYEQCDCVIVPSQYEGFGLAVAEAIVRGIPVIMSDLAVFQEQVELYQCRDRVLFFPVGNADALADCIQAFITNPKPKLDPTIIQQRFGHWTWKTVAQRYTQTLANLKPHSLQGRD